MQRQLGDDWSHLNHEQRKSGCKIEEQKIETAKSLERYLAIDSVGAKRVMGRTKLRRQTPDIPCNIFLEKLQWQALACYFFNTSTPPVQPPSLQIVTRWIAKLGGLKEAS